MTDTEPARRPLTRSQIMRAGGVSRLQWAVLIVGYAALALAVAIVVGVGHAAVPAVAALCALELVLCVGVLLEATAAATGRGSRG